MAESKAEGKQAVVTGQAIPVDSPSGDAPSGPSHPTVEQFLPATHWTERPVEPDDVDSLWGDDSASSTASLTSSILAYRTVNGRTYHAERGNAAYWAANDPTQSEAAEFFHQCALSIGGKLHKAPLDRSRLRKALDVGTGIGTWAIDFADEYQECEVTGTDISPIQPGWVPPNLRFEIEDCTAPWSFEDNTFDYVHIRLLYGSIPDWELLFNEAYRVLKPGGWLESREAAPSMDCDDGTVPPDSAMAQWGKFYYEFGRKTGRTFAVIQDDIQIKNVQRLGMENIEVTELKLTEHRIGSKLPMGAWPKDPVLNEIGRVGQAVMQDSEGWLTFVAREIQGWSRDEVTIFCAHIRREIRNTRYHSFVRHRIVIGQKEGGPDDH